MNCRHRCQLLFAIMVLSTVTCLAGSAWAQNYSFSIPTLDMVNTILPDGSVRIHYTIEFQNHGDAIDIVDIGLPHANYDRHNMSVWINSQGLTVIRDSTYIDVGVEVPLGIYEIPRGQRGVFEFEATLPDLVFSDTSDEELASFRITPTWFDDGLVSGETEIRVVVQLPEGVQADQVVHQGHNFDQKADTEDGALVGWILRDRLVGEHMVGLSFPRAVMTNIVEITKWDLLIAWWRGAALLRVLLAVAFAFSFGIVFFRFTAQTGCALFVLLVGFAMMVFFMFPAAHVVSLPILCAMLIPMEWATRRARRRYLPPIAHVEGGGIKRGLTAPEAAVLLHLPLDRVLTLVIFGLLKKGFIEESEGYPLTVRIHPELDVGERRTQRKIATKMGEVLHNYEQPFLDRLRRKGKVELEGLDFSDALEALIEHTAGRVAAFDLDETRGYYRDIVDQAWDMARAYELPEKRTEHIDRRLSWLLLDDDYARRFNDWESRGYYYRRSWSRPPTHLAPADTRISTSHLAANIPDTVKSGISDFAGSFAGWTENISSGLADGLVGVGSPTGDGAVLNLRGFDRAVDGFIKGLGEGGGGGGGGGGSSCACACAGCACACACAGGGR